MSLITLEKQCVIQRPGHVVRAHFLKIQFREEAPGRTHLRATSDVPARGVNWWMKPIVHGVISLIGDQAIEEDRVGLEQGGYSPPRLTQPA